MALAREVAIVAGLSAMGLLLCDLLEEEPQGKPKRTHRWWVRPWIRERDNCDQNNTILKLYKEILACDDVQEFTLTLRMPPEVWRYLIREITPYVEKYDSNWRDALSPELKLAVFMRYAALGDNYRSLSQQFRVGPSSVGTILREVSDGISDALGDRYGKMPNTKEEWYAIADGFLEKWNLPNTLGAIVGKHVRLQCPPNSGSVFYNYKHFYSMILLAVVDSGYKIVYYDIGAEGKASDGGVWSKSSLRRDFEDERNPKNIPKEGPVDGIDENLPFFLVGDDAFPLMPYLMKPFPTSNLTKAERVFNYRLSRGRRVVENAFGLLASRFRLYRQEIAMHPDGLEKVVRATVILHNMLQHLCAKTYMPRAAIDNEDDNHRVIPGHWRSQEGLMPLAGTRHRNASVHAKNVRRHLEDYFLSAEGAVHWQYEQAGI